MYHSSAILLPDGRVFTGGNGRRGGLIPRQEIEIYYPPYLSDLEARPRPIIEGVPDTLTYNEELRITASSDSPVSAGSITRVTMVALGSTTHQNDMSQRFVELGCREVDGDDVVVRTPHDANYAPPGWYMVFAISDQGTPSLASYVLIREEA